MLRRARWLILLALALIVGFVAATYFTQRDILRGQRPKASAPLPINTTATADGWDYDIKDGSRTKVRIHARTFRQVKEPSTFMLEGLEMRIFARSGDRYDLVKSARASFDIATGLMHSEGDVEILMNLPTEGHPAGRLLKIGSSGVSVDVKTSRVWTEMHAAFEFDKGDGEATGASYDPVSRELRMNSNVKLNWRGSEPSPTTMTVEAGELIYKETANEIYLFPWARLTRGTFSMHSGDALVRLKEGLIDRVEARQAGGADRQPQRQVEYAADDLTLLFTPKTELSRAEGTGHAKLVSTNSSGVTTVDSNRLDLDFAESPEGSILKNAMAAGATRVVSDPPARAGVEPPKRILTSEVVELQMRAGGKEVERLQTHSPGRVDFVPARAGEKHRILDAERLALDYGPGNSLKNFRAMKNVVSRTETPQRDGKVSVALTRSNDLQAQFDPNTGQMTVLEQWNSFEYEEGSRRARAGHAELDSTRQLITLTDQARMWDDTGSTSADRILLQQLTGDIVASGNVSSTRLPRKKDAKGGMLDNSEPFHAQAKLMTTSDRNQRIRYEGDAVMWQGADRLEAQAIQIDGAAGTLAADGGVVSRLQNIGAKDAGKAKTPALTTITARSLTYDDSAKLAHYRGNAKLVKSGLDVSASEMRIWFRDEKDSKGKVETKLDRMFADGAVEVLERMPQRTRRGAGEHAEYYLDDERFLLNGGNPVISDSVRGVSRGREITWYARQDRLIVDNTGSGPSVSRIKRDERR